MAHPLLDQRLDDRAFRLGAFACVLLAVGFAYGNALGAGLVFDSVPIILEDPRIQAWQWVRIRDILLDDYWFGLDSSVYRPLTTLSYAVNYSLLGHGSDPTGYIVPNILIHALNALLVVALARALAFERSVALLAGLVFSVHPVGTEAVTNVVGRADLLAAAGVLAGTLLHVRIARAGRFEIASSSGLLAASALAIGSKENGIVLVGLLVLYDLLFELPQAARPRSLGTFVRERLLRSYLWCLLPFAGYWILRSIALSGGALPPSIPDNPLLTLGPVAARLTAAGILVRYLGLILWPSRLSADYSYDSVPLLHGGIVWLAGPVLAAMVLSALVLRRRVPAVSFFTLFFFVTIAPVSNLFNLVGAIMAERFLYLPSVGLIVLLSWALVRTFTALGRGLPKPRAALAGGGLALLLLAGLAYRTASRNLDWRSGVALFSSAVRVNPGSYKAHQSLAGQLYLSATDEGERMRRIDSIIDHTETAWRILKELPPKVGYSNVLSELAFYYRVKAKGAPESEAQAWLARAEDAYATAIRSEEAGELDGNWRVRLGLAEALRDLGRRDEALASFQAALELAPGREVLEPYTRLLFESGRERETLISALRLITLQPRHEGMWKIVSESYARRFPGEPTVVNSDGRWRVNVQHPAVGAELRSAVQQQYEALVSLGLDRGAESYRGAVIDLLGVDLVTEAGPR